MRLRMHWQSWSAGCLLAALLAGCGTTPRTPSTVSTEPAPATASKTSTPSRSTVPVLPPAGSGRGGYYQDDGPGDNPPDGLMDVPDAEPRIEPLIERANRAYTVFGKTYTPITDNRPFRQRGVGSWYGKKFHGQKTSSGELYDMYKMTAAHPTLPIPSYARITNLATGTQVIVRINDRGPFHSSRIIDLSYTAALKLGYLGKGSGQLEVERLLPDEIERIASEKKRKAAEPAAQASPPAQSAQSAPAMQVARMEAVPPPGQPAPAASQTRPEATMSIDDVIGRAGTGATVAATAVDTPVVLTAAVSPAAEKPATQPAADATAAAPVAAPVATPAVTPAGGFYLQLGAYAQAANAQAICMQIRQKWTVNLPQVEVVESGTLYKLVSGPFATRADAMLAAQQVLESGLSKPLIVQR
jgi:rare lipoprotein A